MINFYVDKDNLIIQQGRGGWQRFHCMWLLIKRLALPSYGHNRINSTTSTRLQRDFNEIVWSELSRSRAMRHILFGVLIDVLHEKRFVDGLSFFFPFEHQTLKQIWIHVVIPLKLNAYSLHPWHRARTWIWSQRVSCICWLVQRTKQSLISLKILNVILEIKQLKCKYRVLLSSLSD